MGGAFEVNDVAFEFFLMAEKKIWVHLRQLYGSAGISSDVVKKLHSHLVPPLLH